MLSFTLHQAVSGSYWIGLFGTAATVAVIAIIFAETGLLLGFFLPGDSLLFAAGLYSVHHTVAVGEKVPPHLNLALLLPGVIVAAIAGSQLGFKIGQVVGPRLFDRPDSRLFKQEYVERTRKVLDRYGMTKAVALSRFIPVVRTFMGPAVGIVGMSPKRYFSVNAVSGAIWAGGVTLAGALVGKHIAADKVDKVILPVVLLIIIVSVVPVVREALRQRREVSNGASQ